MTTRAEIQYWKPATKKVVWYSDGSPDFILYEEIIPAILTYKRDAQEYLLNIMDSELIPRDEWFDSNYRYNVAPADSNEDVFVVEVNGHIFAKVDTHNKVITIFREALEKIGYDEEVFSGAYLPEGYTQIFSP